MTLRTPWIPPLLHERNSSGAIANSARIGTPPIGAAQWADIARAQNWLLVGGSMQLACWGPTTYVGVEAANSETIRAYCWPRPQCFARLWTFVMKGAGAFGTIETADGEHSYATNPDESATVIQIPELVTDTTPTGEEISVVVNVDASSNVVKIQSVVCTEIPLKRAAKSGDASGLGVHESSLDKWKQIGELDASTTEQRSVGGVMRVAAQNWESQHALRRKLFDWQLLTGVSTSSSTFANLFRVNPSCQARHVVFGETSRPCRWAVYASASASAGEVRLTSSIDGSTNTISVTSTTPAWVQSSTAFNCATDNTSATGWIRGSRETCQIDVRATSGNLVIYNVAIGER
jgi:hypothetical protein